MSAGYQQSQQQEQHTRKQLSKAITGAANNGSGLIRITAVNHTFRDGESRHDHGCRRHHGSERLNWRITVITANTFDLQGSTFTNAYTSGGTAKRTQG
jgi:hypothetical protein